MAGRPDPKPRRRIKATRLRYGQLVAKLLRLYPTCECGCGRRSESAHHVVRRGHGDDLLENLMAMAGDGTRLCHGAITSKQRVWDADRQVYIEPAEVLAGLRRRMEKVRLDVHAYVLSTRGPDWLERMYPARIERPTAGGDAVPRGGPSRDTPPGT